MILDYIKASKKHRMDTYYIGTFTFNMKGSFVYEYLGSHYYHKSNFCCKINICTHNPWQCLVQLNLYYQFEFCVARHYNDDQLFICFLCFHMVFNNSWLFMSNVKFNLNSYTFHGHEKPHVNFFFHIHIGVDNEKKIK
jgi:hypothetical protein